MLENDEVAQWLYCTLHSKIKDTRSVLESTLMMNFRARADRRTLALVALIATHFAAALFAVKTTDRLLGLQELPVVVPVVVGLLWGQAILLGQFLVLAATRPVVRILLTTSWFVLVMFLAQPFFRATGGHDAFVGCCVFLATPFVFSAMLSAARLGAGFRVRLCDPQLEHGDGNALRFSLRSLFALTFLMAVALAGVRLARDTVEETAQALLFGLVPAAEVFVLLPLLSLWAALGDKHVGRRSIALTVFAVAAVVGPLFIGRAKPPTYWMLGCPAVLPSVVVLGSLLIVRVIGYRYVVDLSVAFRLVAAPPRKRLSRK